MTLLTAETLTLLGPSKCPADIDTALKRIDAEAELLHLGGSKWWLGVKAPNPKAVDHLADAAFLAKHTGGSAIDDPVERAMNQVDLEKEYTMYQIMAGGFRPICLYDTEGRSPGWDIVDDFRQRDWNYRNMSEAKRERLLKDAISIDQLNKPRIASAAAKMKDAASEAFNFVFRGRRSVGGGKSKRSASPGALNQE